MSKDVCRHEYYLQVLKPARIQNPLPSREASRKWKRQNKEKLAKYHATWKANNRLKSTEYEGRRRAKQAGNYIEKVDYADVVQRDDMNCYLCGESVEHDQLAIDHVIPIFMGGPHIAANLRVVHRTCNISKRHREYEAAAQGFVMVMPWPMVSSWPMGAKEPTITWQ